jgi:FkbM family methyltransferase
VSARRIIGERVPDLLRRVPPFNRPEARYAFVRKRADLARSRRRLFERLGSDRYSHPALHDLDRKLEHYLPEEGGFFVEAGANDGYLQSNTYYFERFKGWTGVLIEPIPELYRRCVRERPSSRVFNCALVPDGYPEQTVRMRYSGLMSLVQGAQGSEEADVAHVQAGTMRGWDRLYELEAPARTLTSVLDEAGAPEIDLLVLDVEGYEAEAMEGLDLERYAPRFLLVEMLEPQPTRTRIEALIADYHEFVEQLSPLDYLYRRRPSPPARGSSQAD